MAENYLEKRKKSALIILDSQTCVKKLKNYCEDKEINKEFSIEHLTYGLNCKVFEKNKLKDYVMCLSHNSDQVLYLIRKQGKKQTKHKIDINRILNIIYEKSENKIPVGNMLSNSHANKNQESNYLGLFYHTLFYEIYFENYFFKNFFLRALLSMFEDHVKEEEVLDNK